jgi:hypothetical protein
LILNLICGVFGICLLIGFVGFMLWWVPALPLIIITVTCVALLIYDFVQTLRFGERHADPSSRK